MGWFHRFFGSPDPPPYPPYDPNTLYPPYNNSQKQSSNKQARKDSVSTGIQDFCSLEEGFDHSGNSSGSSPDRSSSPTTACGGDPTTTVYGTPNPDPPAYPPGPSMTSVYDQFAFEDDTVMPAGRQVKPQNDDDKDDEVLFELERGNRSIRRWKWSVLILLIVCGAAVATTAFLYTTKQQEAQFEQAFTHDATRFVNAFYSQHFAKLWALYSLQAFYEALPPNDITNQYPNVTLRNFETQTKGEYHTSDAASLFYAPLLTEASAGAFVEYAQEELNGLEYRDIFNRPPEERIFTLNENGYPNYTSSSSSSDNKKEQLPIYQVNPASEKSHLNMLDLFSIDENLVRNLVLTGGTPLFGPILKKEIAQFFANSNDTGPRSLALLPISSGNDIVAVAGLEIDWVTYFNDVLSEGPTTLIVLDNTCQPDMQYEFQVSARSGTTYRGAYNNTAGATTTIAKHHHKLSQSTSVEGMKEFGRSQGYDGLYLPESSNSGGFSSKPVCLYRMTVYPMQQYENEYRTSLPIAYTLAATVLTIVAVLLFSIYGLLVDRRQRQVLDSAAKANAIIKSLFPAVVRNRMFGESSSHNDGGSVPSRRASTRRRLTPSPAQTSYLDGANPKNRLTNYLSVAGESEALLGIQEEDPIAEMFSNTTIMFADIAGFTAWSSEREPSQVFKLLETLYHEFDTIAKKLNVFKVETIGDCYVAVSGLPDPNKDHAKIMARFAWEILGSANELTQRLEAVLGPGTSDLGLRVGLHSGPVTAGVLRGEKSRFQLFGDTMNTAARMESTGAAGRIQVSTVTADLISNAGKPYWLTKRDGTVSAKGKGELQTYWLAIRRPDQPAEMPLQETSSYKDNNEVDFDEEPPLPELPPQNHIVHPPHQRCESTRWGQMSIDGGESITSRYSFTMKEDRLIDWNVDVLMGFLEKVVQHRLVTETRGNRWGNKNNMTSDASGSTHGEVEGGLIIDEIAEVITLPKFNSRYSSHLVGQNKLLPMEIRHQMKEFVASIASLYRDTPFHNFEHASHVTMSANKLMKRIITPEDAKKSSKSSSKRGSKNGDKNNGDSPESDLHFNTFGISSDPLTQFAVVFAALIHDVDHTGLTNAQLIKEGASIARIFNNKSIAEQNSVVVAWELLMEPRYADLQQCIFAHDVGRNRFRQLVVNAVMATDIMDSDMVSLRKKRWEKAFDPSLSNELFLLDVDVNRKATIVIEHIIQASDVAHTMQHWRIFIKWNTRLYRELHRAYLNGHSEKDPSEGWYEAQIGFFDNYVIPLAKKLRECGVFGVSGDEYLTYAQQNRTEWEQKGREETKIMIRQNRGGRRISGATESVASVLTLSSGLSSAGGAASIPGQPLNSVPSFASASASYTPSVPSVTSHTASGDGGFEASAGAFRGTTSIAPGGGHQLDSHFSNYRPQNHGGQHGGQFS